MASIRVRQAFAIAAVSLTLFCPIDAANTDVEPRFLGGPCSPYGGYVQSMSTGNGMVQSMSIAVTDTGMFLDNLTIKVTSVDVPQRGAYAYSYVTFANNSDAAGYSIYCTDEDGIAARPEGTPLRIHASNSNNAMLVMRKLGGYGLMPEPYAHYVKGKRVDGTYLGLANRTAWAFAPEIDTSAGRDQWRPRLLLQSEELQKGEVRGFLRVQGY